MNLAVIVLGVPGTGKSTYAAGRALAEGRSIPAYIVAHDPGYRLPETLPDGRSTEIHRHESIGAGRAALASAPTGIHSFAVADGGEVLEFGVACARASLDVNGGAAGTPCIVLLDEGVGTADVNPYRLDGGMRQALATRRHQHIGIIITAQSPKLIHYATTALATEIVMFRMHDERSLRALEAQGIPRATLDKVRALENFHYIVHKLA